MVVSGKDKGSYTFEKQALLEHLTVYQNIFAALFHTRITASLNRRGGYPDSEGFVRRIIDFMKDKAPDMDIVENTGFRSATAVSSMGPGNGSATEKNE